MDKVSNWVLIGASGIVGIGGLFVASHVGHGIGYYGGLAMFAFSVFFVGMLIRMITGHD